MSRCLASGTTGVGYNGVGYNGVGYNGVGSDAGVRPAHRQTD
jgi:hypothetical protein